MPHAYDDPCGLAHARMTQQAYACARGLIAHAQRAFARSLWPLISRVVCNMCAMDNMVLILSCSCHAILSAYELSAPAAGATACMRVRVWPHGARGFARIPLNVLRVAVPACGDVLASALRLRHRCVSTARYSAWHGYLDTWLRGMRRACVCPCVRVCCVFECERNGAKLQ